MSTYKPYNCTLVRNNRETPTHTLMHLMHPTVSHTRPNEGYPPKRLTTLVYI